MKFNRKRDRFNGEYLFISYAELEEQNISTHVKTWIGNPIIYNDVPHKIVGISNLGILIQKSEEPRRKRN